MNPLSIFTYYLRNKRRALPVLVIIALAVFGITLGVMLTGNIQEQAKMDLAVYKRFITVRPNWREGHSTLSPILKMELRRLPSLEALHTAIEFWTYLPLVVGGNTSTMVIAVEKDVIPYLMRRCDLVLKEGRLPRRNANELAIHEGVAKLRGLSLGSELSYELDEREWIRGKWKVVGILSGPIVLNIAPLEYTGTRSEYRNWSRIWMLFPKEGRMAELEREAEEAVRAEREKKRIQPLDTYSYWKRRYDEFMWNLDISIWVINSVLVFVLSLAVGLLNTIYFLQRMNEFGLLAAIGYSRLYLVWRAVRESLGLTITAWIFGLIFSQTIYGLLEHFVLGPKGILIPKVFGWRTISYTLPIPLMVGLFSISTVVWQLLKLDPVAIIERRD